MRHATCNSRTTVEQQHAQSTCRKHRITHLPVAELAAPYRRLESICASSDPEGRADRKRRRETRQKKRKAHRATAHTRTEKCWFLLCGQPPARMPVRRRCSLSLPLSPPPAPIRWPRFRVEDSTAGKPRSSVMGVSQHSMREKETKGGNMRAKGGAERERVCTTAAFLLMHLRLVVGSGPFCPFPSAAFVVSCIACLAGPWLALPFHSISRLHERHPGRRTKMCQYSSAARTWGWEGWRVGAGYM
jgi:hypothetical protein